MPSGLCLACARLIATGVCSMLLITTPLPMQPGLPNSIFCYPTAVQPFRLSLHNLIGK